jgi:hypothetical protein
MTASPAKQKLFFGDLYMTATMNSTELTLQKRGNCCWTAQWKIIKITVIYILAILLCVGTTVGVYMATRPNIVDHP